MTSLQRTIVIIAVLAMGAVALIVGKEAFAGMCLTGALGLAVPQKRDDEPSKPAAVPTGLMLLLVAGLALAASACGASQKVRIEVRAGDISLLEYIMAHDCPEARLGLDVRRMTVEGLKPPLEKLEAHVCAGSWIKGVVGVVSSALGRNAGDVVMSLFATRCGEIFEGVYFELDAGTEQGEIAYEDKCTEPR